MLLLGHVCGLWGKKASKKSPISSKAAMQTLIFLKDPMVLKLLHVAPWLCVHAVAPWLLQVCYFFITTTAICFCDSLTFFLPFSVLLLHQFILPLENCGPQQPCPEIHQWNPFSQVPEAPCVREAQDSTSSDTVQTCPKKDKHFWNAISLAVCGSVDICTWNVVYGFLWEAVGARGHESQRSAGQPYACMFSSCLFFREVVLHPAMAGAGAKYISCSGVSEKGSATCPRSAGMGSASGLWGHTLCFVLFLLMLDLNNNSELRFTLIKKVPGN